MLVVPYRCIYSYNRVLILLPTTDPLWQRQRIHATGEGEVGWLTACGMWHCVCLLIHSVGAVATSPIANPLRVARPPLIL